MPGFAMDTDYFGFADTNLKFIGSSKEPSKQWAEQPDSNGDIVAREDHDTVMDITCRYALQCGASINLAAWPDTTTPRKLGQTDSAGKLVAGINANTGQQWPVIEVTGNMGLIGKTTRTFPLPAVTLLGIRKAQAIGGAADAGNAIASSSVAITAQYDRGLDSEGDGFDHEIYGARAVATNEINEVTAPPGFTADTAWTEDAEPSVDKENTGYGSGSISLTQILTPDTGP